MMNLKEKNILITGGAGYIGSHFIATLGDAGCSKITTIDNLSTGRKESILYGELIVEDLSNYSVIENIIRENKFDAVFHFAGSIVVPESIQNPIKYYENNTLNSFNLIKLCCKYGINNFVFSSTAATYGIVSSGVAYEETPQVPITPYGYSKFFIEQMLKDISNSNLDFKFVALRYFNVAGADSKGRIGQCFPNATHLIKVCSEAAIGKRDKVEIFGTDYSTPDGTCIRDYIHIDDLVSAHISVYEYLIKNKKSEFFNCGYGKGYSVREVIESVKKISENDFAVKEVLRREGDLPKLISNSEKIRNLTTWQSQFDDLDYIVRSAYEWEKIRRIN